LELAFLDSASVGMRAVPIAVALAHLPQGTVVDPTMEEEEGAVSRHVFGWAFGAGISTESRGEMEVDEEVESELVWAR
jgi:exosome complex RNA-binding protein Rrp42 (RNase PH superfamily)